MTNKLPIKNLDKELDNLFQSFEHFMTPYDETRVKNFILAKLAQQKEEICKEIENAPMSGGGNWRRILHQKTKDILK